MNYIKNMVMGMAVSVTVLCLMPAESKAVNAPPKAPTALVATQSACGSNHISVTWRSEPSAVLYNVYGKVGAGPFVQLAQTGTASYGYTGVPGRLVTFKVQSVASDYQLSDFSYERSQIVPFTDDEDCNSINPIQPAFTPNSITMTGSTCQISAGNSNCRVTNLKLDGYLYGGYDLRNNTTGVITNMAFAPGDYTYGGEAGSTIGYGSTSLSVRSMTEQMNTTLGQITFNVSCVAGTTWNGTKCSGSGSGSGGGDTALPNGFFPQVVAIGQTNNSIKLVQQILFTDPQIYPEGIMSGYFGELTKSALTRFQTKFGLRVTGTFTPETSFVFSYLLGQAPLSVINNVPMPIDYLRNPLVHALITTAVGNFRQTTDSISSVRAVKDYLLGRTTVVVNYSNKKRERFVIPLVKPEATITDRIATKLNRPAADLAGKVTYSSVNAKVVSKIEMTLKPRNKKEADFNLTYLDETTEFRRITPDEANQTIAQFFGGDEERFVTAVDGYIQEVREGGVSEDLVQFVSDLTGETKARVRSVLTVKVEVYPDDGGGGGDGGGG